MAFSLLCLHRSKRCKMFLFISFTCESCSYSELRFAEVYSKFLWTAQNARTVTDECAVSNCDTRNGERRGSQRNSGTISYIFMISKPIKSRNFYWLQNQSTRIPYKLHTARINISHTIGTMNTKFGFGLCSHALLPKSQLFIIIPDRTHFTCVDMSNVVLYTSECVAIANVPWYT